MADRTLLHQGSFNDRDGNIIKVSFYHRVDINAYPESLHIGPDGGTLNLVIWSRDGDAALGDPSVDWWNYHQVKAEKILGTHWYRYYYEITVDANTGDERTTEIRVYNDDGEVARMVVPLIQDGQE